MPLPEILSSIAKLSPAQYSLLNILNQIGQQTGIERIAKEADLHPNSVRETLDGLIRAGLVVRHRQVPLGRGRPAWVYEPIAPGSRATFYQQLVDLILASVDTISADCTVPEAALAQANKLGRDWGKRYLSSLSIPDHSTYSRLTQSEQIDVHVSKVRGFLFSLGFQIRSGKQVTELWIQEFPTCHAALDKLPLIAAIYQGMMSYILGHLSRGRIGISFEQQAGEKYLARLLFTPDQQSTDAS